VKPGAAPSPLTLRSRLSELTHAVFWLNDLASYFHIPQTTRYAMDLCLEEALSNVIRHGYLGDASGTIVVRHRRNREGELQLVVEDEAPAFDPLTAETPQARDESPVGGFGIGLMRRFATTVTYERLATGNRLILGFSWR
jgi:anti-sigma regulatory factor (Ser/Thr protein kinase)